MCFWTATCFLFNRYQYNAVFTSSCSDATVYLLIKRVPWKTQLRKSHSKVFILFFSLYWFGIFHCESREFGKCELYQTDAWRRLLLSEVWFWFGEMGWSFPELLKVRLCRCTAFMSLGCAWCLAFKSVFDICFWLFVFIYIYIHTVTYILHGMVIKCLIVSLHIQTPWLFCCQQGLQCARVHPQCVCFLLGKLIVICLIYLKLIASHLNMVGLDPPTISVNSELQSLGQGSTVAHKCPNSRYGADILMVMLHVSVDVFLFHFVSFCFICILFVLFMLFCVSPFTRYFYHVCPRQNFRFPGGSVSLLWHCAHWHPNLWGSWPTPAFFKLSSKAGSVVSREGTLQRFLNKVEGLAMRRSGSKSHLKKQNKKRLQTMFTKPSEERSMVLLVTVTWPTIQPIFFQGPRGKLVSWAWPRYLRHFVDHSLHGNSSHHPQHLGGWLWEIRIATFPLRRFGWKLQ